MQTFDVVLVKWSVRRPRGFPGPLALLGFNNFLLNEVWQGLARVPGAYRRSACFAQLHAHGLLDDTRSIIVSCRLVQRCGYRRSWSCIHAQLVRDGAAFEVCPWLWRSSSLQYLIVNLVFGGLALLFGALLFGTNFVYASMSWSLQCRPWPEHTYLLIRTRLDVPPDLNIFSYSSAWLLIRSWSSAITSITSWSGLNTSRWTFRHFLRPACRCGALAPLSRRSVFITINSCMNSSPNSLIM